MTTTRKRHHYVSEAHQKRFVDAEGFLYVFDKDRPQEGICRRKPKNFFVEGHRYSAYRQDGSRDDALEVRLGELDGQANTVMQKIVDAARGNQPPRLSTSELDVWLKYFVIQWKRVPDLHLTVTTDADAEAGVRQVIAELRSLFPHRAPELDGLNTPEAIRRTVQNGRVNSLESMSDQLKSVLLSRGLGVVRAPPRRRFVLASRPVAKFSRPGQGHLLNPEVEMWLPIAEDVAVGIGTGRGTERLFEATVDQVRHINVGLHTQSTIIASASLKLIESLITAR